MGQILSEFDYFHTLRTIGFPPLYNENSFEFLEGFLATLSDPDVDDKPGMSFSQIEIKISRNMVKEVITEFQALVRSILSSKIINSELLEPEAQKHYLLIANEPIPDSLETLAEEFDHNLAHEKMNQLNVKAIKNLMGSLKKK